MEIAFLLKKLITQLVLPPFNLLLLAIFGLLIARRWPRLGRTLTWTSLLLVLLLATPVVSHWLLQPLIAGPAFDAETGKTAQAIVILGGGLRTNTPEYGNTPTQFTLDRVRYGATLAKQTHLPVLVTGGAVFAPPPEAEVMANVLQTEFNVPVRWIEKQSRDTEDNMIFSAAILKTENINRIILVTHDIHMRRALAHCANAGLVCIPAPVSFGGRGGDNPWFYELPNAGSLQTSAMALHEILGSIALSMR
jgi:uncharacterized SAM-binding protein YcdF (DUF218 family)